MLSMKVMVIGSSGKVGYALCQLLHEKAISVIAPARHEMDLTHIETVLSCIQRTQPDIIVNAAVYNDPVGAENEPSRCFHVNRDSIAVLADTCHQQGIKLIQLSSYRVFDGQKQEPYAETDSTNPKGVLAISRCQAEQQIRDRCPQHIILRFSWIIGEYGNSMLTQLLDQITLHHEITVTSDQVGCPTPATDAARVIVAIIQQMDCGAQVWGTYHYAASEFVSQNSFAEVVIAEASKYTPLKVRKLKMAKMDTLQGIKPPANACLSCQSILNTFGVHQRSWRKTVARIIKNYYEHHVMASKTQ
ncbi:dTDP-4-dehydrorhamnose reductase [invertebrate metagenome]|uniref:dTDP-4-dehydrorhamnose reductase n=1 Tax=invertebrate metagenome TaxID=1711999 RepID=A0A2H9T6X6_9ZZZZ